MSLFLGLDCSTQGLKAEVIDIDAGNIVFSESVNFGKDLPEYKSPNGYLENSDPLIKHSDPLMWVAALDLLFEKMQKQNAPLERVAGISGSGQQHGTVYLNNEFPRILSGLDKHKRLPELLAPALSRPTSPIWMDRSTSDECQELQDEFGKYMQEKTGSPAVERFSAAQIRKFMKDTPALYYQTAHIHLVSSFMASILAGKNAAIDYGDGAGMNLLNLETLQWDKNIVEFTAEDLLKKLPEAVAGNSIIGNLSDYFCKYGFKAGIPIVVWSGDNPCSLIGTGASEPGVAVISLGTSDTFFAAMHKFQTDPEGYGHILGNPAGGFMSLICFSNGSLAREKVKEECQASWEEFNSLPLKTPAGNSGNMMLPYFSPESTPLVLNPEIKYSGDKEFCSGASAPESKIRAILESQALTMKLHSGWIGEEFKRIRVTGGASNCSTLLQIIADIFQAQVEKISITDSAGLGAALRAANAVNKLTFTELCKKFTKSALVIKPDTENASVYQKALEKYAELEKY
jgi:xylulokinase